MISELVEVKNELKELKDTNKTMVSADDAYQMKAFWNKNRRGMEEYIAKKIAACTKIVEDTKDDFTKRFRICDRKIAEVWKKEEARTERLDTLIKNKKKQS